MVALTCKKCGGNTRRNSGAQKYCASCSPDHYRLKGPGVLKCKKCGTETERINNSQNFCMKCSPWAKDREHAGVLTAKNKRPLPDLVCVRCKKEYGKGAWNQSWGLDLKPCPSCKDIQERKEKREKFLQAKVVKKHKTKMLKELMAIEDEERKESKYPHNVWTRRRYVSQAEIDAVTGCKSDTYTYPSFMNPDGECKTFTRRRPADVLAFSYSWGVWRVVDGIWEPGWHRVEPLKRGAYYFETACSGGIPEHHANGYVKQADHRVVERQCKGLDRKYAKERLAIVIECRKNEFARSKEDKAAKAFFTSIAMAAAVGKAIKQARQ
jgi:hypothetical protein